MLTISIFVLGQPCSDVLVQVCTYSCNLFNPTGVLYNLLGWVRGYSPHQNLIFNIHRRNPILLIKPHIPINLPPTFKLVLCTGAHNGFRHFPSAAQRNWDSAVWRIPIKSSTTCWFLIVPTSWHTTPASLWSTCYTEKIPVPSISHHSHQQTNPSTAFCFAPDHVSIDRRPAYSSEPRCRDLSSRCMVFFAQLSDQMVQTVQYSSYSTRQGVRFLESSTAKNL